MYCSTGATTCAPRAGRGTTVAAANIPSSRCASIFRGSGAGVTLLYGHPSYGAPRYDLALLAPQVIGARAHEVAPAPEAPAEDRPTSAGTAIQTRFFWGTLIVAVLVLLVLIGRLLAKGE